MNRGVNATNRRRAAGLATAWAAFALAVLCQRYWPVMAGEPATRQLAFLKALVLLPVLLSVDRIKSLAAAAHPYSWSRRAHRD